MRKRDFEMRFTTADVEVVEVGVVVVPHRFPSINGKPICSVIVEYYHTD